MGMDPVTMAAISGGANLVGGMLDRRADKKSASKFNRRQTALTNQAMGMLTPAYESAQQGLVSGYGMAGDINQEAYNRNTALMGQSFMPQMQTYQAGNVAAQQALLDSLPMMRSAVLGGSMPNRMQAQALPINQTALQGLINPQAQQFQQYRPR